MKLGKFLCTYKYVVSRDEKLYLGSSQTWFGSATNHLGLNIRSVAATTTKNILIFYNRSIECDTSPHRIRFKTTLLCINIFLL